MLRKLKSYPTIVLTSFLLVGGLQHPSIAHAYELHLSGSVTNSEGSPIEGVCVIFYTTHNTGTISQQLIQHLLTDSNGTYVGKRAEDVSTKTLKVGFSHPDYFTTWYSGASDEVSATSIAMSESRPTHIIDAVLESGGGRISGKVTVEDVIPNNRVGVRIYSDTDKLVSFMPTDSRGNYSTGGLKTGLYKVKFSQYNSDTWYDGFSNIASATPVKVNAPSVTTGIDGVLLKQHE